MMNYSHKKINYHSFSLDREITLIFLELLEAQSVLVVVDRVWDVWSGEMVH